MMQEEPAPAVPYGAMLKLEEEPQTIQTSRSKWAKVRSWLNSMSVEPVLFLFMMVWGLTDVAIRALVYKRVCLSIYANDTYICDNLGNTTFAENENEVQTETSHWNLVQDVTYEVPAIVTGFLFGALGDRYSRRLVLILPSLGQLFGMVTLLVYSMTPSLPVSFIVVCVLSVSIMGGWVGMGMACFSFISDVSSAESRTTRIAYGEAAISYSQAIGVFLSGVILDNTSFEFVFSLAIVISLLNILYIAFVVKEPCAENRKSIKEFSIKEPFIMAKQSVKTIFKKRENNRRCYLLTLFVLVFLGLLSAAARWLLGFLFLKHQPLSWTQEMYGYYNGNKTDLQWDSQELFTGLHATMSALVLTFVIPWLKEKRKVQDMNIFFASVIAGSASEVWMSLCTKTWMVFLVPILSCFIEARSTALRSMVSNMVEKDELGRVFATYGVLQSLSVLTTTGLYNSIYPLTLHFWNGFCFVLGACISIIPFCIGIWLKPRLNTLHTYEAMDGTEETSENDASDAVPVATGINYIHI